MRALKIGFVQTLLMATAMIAASPCPTIGLTTYEGPSNQPYLTAGGGCNEVITINANGSTGVTTVNSNPFEGSDDTLVGLVNNSASAISTITVSGPSISAFEGDGVCLFASGGLAGDTWTSGNSSYCSVSQLNGTDPQDYQGPNMTFTNFAGGSSVTINFSPPLAAGGTTFFSLEAPPSSSLVVTVGLAPAGTPTLTTWGMILLAGALLLFGMKAARRAIA